jgi:hypothetical protein
MYDTYIGQYTLNANQTISPKINDYIHSIAGYSSLRIVYSQGQNYFQCSTNFVPNGTSQDVYATITNHFTGTLTSDFRVFELFVKGFSITN